MATAFPLYAILMAGLEVLCPAGLRRLRRAYRGNALGLTPFPEYALGKRDGNGKFDKVRVLCLYAPLERKGMRRLQPSQAEAVC